MNHTKQIPEMSREELEKHLKGLRVQRKQGYEMKKRTRRNNPFSDLDPELAKKVLEELEKQNLV